MLSKISKICMGLMGKQPQISIMIIGLDNSGKTGILSHLLSNRLDGKVVRKLIGDTNGDKLDGSRQTEQVSSASTSAISPTIGYSYERVRFKGTIINVLDFSGQNRYRNLWQEFYSSVDGIVFVIDSSDLIRLVVVRDELETLLCNPYFNSLTNSSNNQPFDPSTVQKQIMISHGALIQSSLDGARTPDSMVANSLASQLSKVSELGKKGRRRTRVPILFLANKSDLPSSTSTEAISKAINLSQLPKERHPWLIQATSVVLNQGIDEAFSWLLGELTTDLVH